jgi:hypothetical protein
VIIAENSALGTVVSNKKNTHANTHSLILFKWHPSSLMYCHTVRVINLMGLMMLLTRQNLALALVTLLEGARGRQRSGHILQALKMTSFLTLTGRKYGAASFALKSSSSSSSISLRPEALGLKGLRRCYLINAYINDRTPKAHTNNF